MRAENLRRCQPSISRVALGQVLGTAAGGLLDIRHSVHESDRKQKKPHADENQRICAGVSRTNACSGAFELP
jgi:hypothetical protein